jgi:hypothetical protein
MGKWKFTKRKTEYCYQNVGYGGQGTLVAPLLHAWLELISHNSLSFIGTKQKQVF